MTTFLMLGLGAIGVFPSVVADDPQQPNLPMLALLNELGSMNPLPVDQQDPRVARELPGPSTAAASLLSKMGKPGVLEVTDVSHFVIPSSTGGLLVRMYRGKGAPSENAPGLVYFHGGGWVIGSLDSYDSSCRAIANMSKCCVYSVGYRLAPEHKFPAAHDDAYTSTKWIMEHAAKVGADPKRIAIGGESAGGNLAIATALRLKREGAMLPDQILAVYPIAGYDYNTPSYIENAEAKPLNAVMMKWFFKHYLRTKADGKNDYISLVDAKDLAGLPRTTFVFAQIDPLRSEGQMLAEHLRSAGVTVEDKLYNGVTHEFFGMGALVPEARQAEMFVAKSLGTTWNQ